MAVKNWRYWHKYHLLINAVSPPTNVYFTAHFTIQILSMYPTSHTYWPSVKGYNIVIFIAIVIIVVLVMAMLRIKMWEIPEVWVYPNELKNRFKSQKQFYGATPVTCTYFTKFNGWKAFKTMLGLPEANYYFFMQSAHYEEGNPQFQCHNAPYTLDEEIASWTFCSLFAKDMAAIAFYA